MIQSLNASTSSMASFFLALLELLRRGEAGGVEGVAGDELEVELDELVEELELEDSEKALVFFDRAARPRPRPPRPRSRPRPRPLGCGSRGSNGKRFLRCLCGPSASTTALAPPSSRASAGGSVPPSSRSSSQPSSRYSARGSATTAELRSGTENDICDRPCCYATAGNFKGFKS